MSRLAFWRRAPCAGCGAESAPVDLLQLVDAQETALAELIEESHCAMRKLLQTHPIPENRTIDTARFSNRLNAQLEHLRVYMAEERSKLQQTLVGTEPSRCSPFSFLISRGVRAQAWDRYHIDLPYTFTTHMIYTDRSLRAGCFYQIV